MLYALFVIPTFFERKSLRKWGKKSFPFTFSHEDGEGKKPLDSDVNVKGKNYDSDIFN